LTAFSLGFFSRFCFLFVLVFLSLASSSASVVFFFFLEGDLAELVFFLGDSDSFVVLAFFFGDLSASMSSSSSALRLRLCCLGLKKKIF